MSTFRVPSCQSLCQLHLGTKLFVFINIQCFLSVFISKVPSCICQLQWKARDTTESGSRFNRFHAISTALRGVCLPLAEERLSHTGGFLSSWYSPTLQRLENGEGDEAAGFCSQAFLISHLHMPTAWWLFSKTGNNEVQMRWGAICSAQRKSGVFAQHTLSARRSTQKQQSIMIINMSKLYSLRANFMNCIKLLGPVETLYFNLMWLAFIVPTKVILPHCKHVISNPNYFCLKWEVREFAEERRNTHT